MFGLALLFPITAGFLLIRRKPRLRKVAWTFNIAGAGAGFIIAIIPTIGFVSCIGSAAGCTGNDSLIWIAGFIGAGVTALGGIIAGILAFIK